ncbi:MAG: hypothetical protein Ct9H300mP1_34940 [Planctomycetaceae bacterium]|nr:MAG: hypothetical protein Ct9H300mP1_34940 [Planctomycetaceae bacterium]
MFLTATAGAQDVGKKTSPETFWVTADRLMPAWGFYPLQASYGGTRPLGQHAAWCSAGNSGRLTWIAEFPRQAEYHVWVRNYGATVLSGLGGRSPVVAGRGGRAVDGSSGATPARSRLPPVASRRSRRGQGDVDAVAFTTDAKLVPSKGNLPTGHQPRLRAARTYGTIRTWRPGPEPVVLSGGPVRIHRGPL